jgi:nucleosome binding factor SPN SPT16 subunit
VFKDFTRPVHRIDCIPIASVDKIKEWLNSVNIKYYENKVNINWGPVQKTILEDPEKFVDEGG